MKCEVLVCFAVKEEAASFRRRVAGRIGVFILVTGIGQKNAEQAVREFLTTQSPRMVLTCGFAGGLNPVLKPGEVIFCTEDENLREQLLKTTARSAKMFCATRIAITAAEKQALRASTGADVVEMESERIQSVCLERGIPCATVRVISDAADEDLPLDFNQLSKADLNLDYAKLALEICKSPWKIGALMRLQKRCRYASEQLAEVLTKITFR